MPADFKPSDVVLEVLREDVDAGTEPLASLARNPFFKPGYEDLVADGYAVWATGEAPRGELALTEKGLAAIERWVRRPPAAAPTEATA